jgi:hypothetical protein
VSDDLSKRLQQHANWLYGIGTPPSPMTPADFLAAGARIDRLQAELDIARGQLLSNERGDDRRHYICVCPDCVKTKAKLKPLDFKQSQIVASAAHIDYCLNKHSSYEMALIRGTERAHGIEEKPDAP